MGHSRASRFRFRMAAWGPNPSDAAERARNAERIGEVGGMTRLVPRTTFEGGRKEDPTMVDVSIDGDARFRDLAEHGYVVIEDALSPAEVAELRDQLVRQAEREV